MIDLRHVAFALGLSALSAGLAPAQDPPPSETPHEPSPLARNAGDEQRPRVGDLRGRHRLELRFGYADKGGASVDSRAGGVTSSVGLDNFAASAGYSYWFRPELAVSLSVTQLNSAVENSVWHGTRNEISDVFSVLVGLRRDFLSGAEDPRVRPYLTAGLGPYFGSSVLDRVGAHGVSNSVRTTSAFGGQVGGGVDVQISRRVMLGVRADYDFMTDFADPVGGRDNYSGVEAGLSLSLLFGKGSPPRSADVAAGAGATRPRHGHAMR